MFQSLKRWLDSLLSAARKIISRVTGRRSGQWVEGSYTDPNRSVLFLPLPQAKRIYRLYLPGRYDSSKKLPLVVMLHGCKQDALAFAGGTRMNELANREGFLVLYPEQRRLANAYRCWNWFATSSFKGGGEAALIAGMVREVTATYAVDPSRVYVTGISAGGAMTSIMASCYGHLFAACAVHSGLMYRAAQSVLDAARSMKNGSDASPAQTALQAMATKDFAFVPALVIHGSEDDVVHPRNADQVVEQFIAMSGHAGDGAVRLTESKRNESTGNDYPYATSDYRRGNRLLLRKVLVEGLRHAWSGGNAEHEFNDLKGPDASRMIWEFFAGFEREPALGDRISAG